MLLTTLKWAILVLVIAAVAAALFTRKEFHAETIISAPPEKVWTVLMETGTYSEWNPVFVRVSGDYREEQTLTNTVRFPDGKDVDMGATIKTLIENRELRQTGGIPGFLSFDHRWLLEPVEGGTKVIQHEVDRGIYLWFWDSSWVEPAYQRTTEALKKRVEAGE